eukprot:5882571-Karenia_brevis.AAC.1
MARVRALVPFGAELAADYCTGSPRDKQRCGLMNRLNKIYEFVYRGPLVPSTRESKRFIADVDAFLAHSMWLAADAAAQHKPDYHIINKHHHLWHMGQD